MQEGDFKYVIIILKNILGEDYTSYSDEQLDKIIMRIEGSLRNI